MEKKEYVSPEMEIVEITEQYNILGMSDPNPDDEIQPGLGGGNRG